MRIYIHKNTYNTCPGGFSNKQQFSRICADSDVEELKG